MTQIIEVPIGGCTPSTKLQNPHEIRIPAHLSISEAEVENIIKAFNSDGVVPEIIATEGGELVSGINALEAAKRLNQQMVMVVIKPTVTTKLPEVQLIPIELLDPHPINSKIYGESEDVTSLAESIAENGLQESFTVSPVITPKGTRYEVIHGHRRRLACLKVGIESVPCKIKVYESKEDEIAALLSGNEYREKSIEQKAREYLVWIDIEKERARQRCGKAGIGQGAARDVVAKRVGLGSGVNAEHAVAAVKALDETSDAPVGTARHQQYEQLKQILSRPRGVDAAYKLIAPQPIKAPTSKPQEPKKWVPKEYERIRISAGIHKNKLATVTVILGFQALCHIDGTPETKREQILFTQMQPIDEGMSEELTSVRQLVKQQQQDLGLGSREQVLPSISSNVGVEPVEQMQASATNFNVVGDALTTEIAIALLKLSPKQMHEVMKKVEPDLTTHQLEAIWKALESHLSHKAAA